MPRPEEADVIRFNAVGAPGLRPRQQPPKVDTQLAEGRVGDLPSRVGFAASNARPVRMFGGAVRSDRSQTR